MLSSLLLTTLVATASAIDVGLHSGVDCEGSALVCPRINPGTCCKVDSGHNSASVRFIPTNWDIRGVAYKMLASCTTANVERSANSNGATKLCLHRGSNYIGGISYFFNNRKRDEEANTQGECVKPSVLELEDGSRIDVGGLEEAQLAQLWTGMKRGDPIPEEIMARES